MSNSAGFPDQASELAKRWFRIALWVAALPPAIGAIGLAFYERNLGQIHGDEVGASFILWLILNEAFSLLPILLFARWMRGTLVSYVDDLRQLKAAMAGAIIGMLSPYVYSWSYLTWSALTTTTGLEGSEFGQVYPILVGLTAFAMCFTTVIGALVGWAIGKMILGQRQSPPDGFA